MWRTWRDHGASPWASPTLTTRPVPSGVLAAPPGLIVPSTSLILYSRTLPSPNCTQTLRWDPPWTFDNPSLVTVGNSSGGGLILLLGTGGGTARGGLGSVNARRRGPSPMRKITPPARLIAR